MIDILKQLTTGVTYKTILKRQMAKYHAAKSFAALDMVRSILADSVFDIVQYRNWLDNLGGLGADKQIIASYVSEGDYANAQTMLGLLPTLYGLEEDALNKYNDYKAIALMQVAWDQQEKSVFDLDESEITVLQVYADSSKGTARYIAQGILNFAYDFDYCDCPIISDTSFMKSSETENPDPLDRMFSAKVSVSPNPAGEWTTFYFELPNNSSVCNIKITNVTGSVVKTFTVTGKQGQQLWDTRKIRSGVYFYTLNVNGKTKSGKIVINK
ncbi:MAG: T9SS type A sorting domain-containing protein [Chlorobi bacterium]|nr:T9SS type A sorting domain-containing protein [Chlorobiota bacterium]